MPQPKLTEAQDALNWEGWTPTADNINALPKPLRDFICHLETEADLAGTTADNFRLRQENENLRAECQSQGQALAAIELQNYYGAQALEKVVSFILDETGKELPDNLREELGALGVRII